METIDSEDEVRLFLDDAGYRRGLEDQRQGAVRIKKDAMWLRGISF